MDTKLQYHGPLDLSLLPATSQSDYEVESDMAEYMLFGRPFTNLNIWSGDLIIQPPPPHSETLVPTDIQCVSQGLHLVSCSNTSADRCTHCGPIFKICFQCLTCMSLGRDLITTRHITICHIITACHIITTRHIITSHHHKTSHYHNTSHHNTSQHVISQHVASLQHLTLVQHVT